MGDDEDQTRTGGESSSPVSVIDAGVALDLLAAAVAIRGESARHDARGGVVAAALEAGGLDEGCLANTRRWEIRTLWVRRALPIPLTFGALVVLNSAQQAERHGASWGTALQTARRSAERLAGLCPPLAAICSRSAGESVTPRCIAGQGATE